MRVKASSPALADAVASAEGRDKAFGPAADAVRLLVGLLRACRSVDDLLAQPPTTVTPVDDRVLRVELDFRGHHVGTELSTTQESEASLIIHRLWIDQEETR